MNQIYEYLSTLERNRLLPEGLPPDPAELEAVPPRLSRSDAELALLPLSDLCAAQLH